MKSESIKRWQYYVIIGVVSVVALTFLPMIGTQVGLAWNIPTTTVGWIVYVVSKLIVAAVNILIFHCFVLQGKTNISQDKRYLEANEILSLIEDKSYIPKSPKEWHIGVYGKKGTTVFITSIVSSVGLTQAILTFDVVVFLTYLFTVLGGIIFGILQMNQEEAYWTEEYLAYAKYIQRRTLNDRNKRQTVEEPGRAGSEEQGRHSETLSSN